MSDDLIILGVTFDSKMTFEKHLRSVSRAASQRLDILRKSWRVFHDRSLLGRCLENGKEARIVQIDFSAAFDRVNQLGILYKLCSVGIGCSVLSILTQFLSNRSQHVMVDGCRSKLVNVVSGVPQGSVFGALLFLL